MTSNGQQNLSLTDFTANFASAVPKNCDEIFLEPSSTISAGSGGVYEPFVVKVQVDLLVKGNCITVFSDPIDSCKFEDLVLVGIAMVIETIPVMISKFFALDSEGTDITLYPEHMTLKRVKSIYAFNEFGVGRIPQPMVARFPKTALGVCSFSTQIGDALPRSSSVLQSLPPSNMAPDNGYKAKLNESHCQNLKVLCQQDKRKFINFVGKMEDLSGDQAINSIHSKVPESYPNLIILQRENIKVLCRLMFMVQAPTASSDVSKAVTGLHLSQFRFPNQPIASTYHIRLGVDRLVTILRVVVGGDEDKYVYNIFATLTEQLHSSEEDGLCRVDVGVLMQEVSARLVEFSKVLSDPEALTKAPERIAEELMLALSIDRKALSEKNIRRLGQRMVWKLGEHSEGGWKRDRTADGDEGGADPESHGEEDFCGGSSRHGGRATYCLAQVCFKYLGSRKFDERGPLTACPGNGRGCRWVHDIPRVPVTPSQKKDLFSLIKLCKGKERKEALLRVMAKPTFSK